jgi:hypothetical protein
MAVSAAIASDLARALDPVLLAAQVGIVPDPWQANVLRSSSSRLLLNCSRQSGKSTITSVLAVHTALYEAGSLVLLLSPSLRQSGELFKKCLTTYKDLGRPVAPESETALTLTLDNGSRIVSLPGSKDGNIRGYSGVNLLVIDEAAWVVESLYMSVRPMLAVSGGRMLALSTPHGTRGWFYEAWRGVEPWERYEVPAPLCPRISEEFLAEERRNMGEWWYDQEYMCQFSEAETQAFRREDVERAFREDIDVWDL